MIPPVTREGTVRARDGRTLAYSENLLGSAVLAAPVLWWSANPVLAMNLVELVSCALCGIGEQ